LAGDELRFASQNPLGGGREVVRWDAVREAGTATVDMPGGRGGPDLAAWVPDRMEWLVLSRRDGGRSLMCVLPKGPERDAVVAAVRDRLGPRWIGEGLPLQDAQKRLGIASSTRGETLRVIGLVASVLALLFVLLLALAVLSTFLLPAGFALGAWLFHRGLAGLRDALAIAGTPPSRVASAALGLVELEGRAIAATPSPAGITGRPSVWWDAAVDAWYADSDGGGQWRQVAARHGGTIDTVELEDDTGRIPIWLRDADLLLEVDTWETGRDDLPSPGAALLEGIGFGWSSGTKLRVRETRLEQGAPMYVLGTLDERRHLPEGATATGVARLVELARTGEWRGALLQRLPAWSRMTVAVLFGFLDLLTKVGRGGERPRRAEATAPPDLPPTAVIVWKGRLERPFVVSNRHEEAALAHLRQRSLAWLAIGAAILCYCLYETLSLLAGSAS
jgi:hypothetical protein